jgi:hypothetical protein
VLGVGSTIIVWSMIEFDPLRLDFYLSVLAAAGPISFLVHLFREQDADRRERARATAVALNLGCAGLAVVLAATRPQVLADPVPATVLSLLLAAPLLNVAALLRE